MTRPMPAWVTKAAIAATCLLLGAAVGIGVAPHKTSVILAYCSIEGESHVPPCPPDTNREVWATWPGDVTIRARWQHHQWHFDQPILGVRRTSEPPVSWREL